MVLQEYTFDRSGAFRSANPAPCTVWPRTVMRGKSRKLTSGHNSVPKSARRPEPSPRFSRLAANASLSGQRKVKGVSRGDIGNRRCPTSPFAPAVGTASPGRRRRPLPTPSEGVNLASGGTPLDRRKGLPPADDKVFKDLQSLLQRLFLKNLAFHPAVRYNKTTRRGKAFTSRISLTALSLRKGAKAIRTAGSNAEHGNFVALLNFYKLAD